MTQQTTSRSPQGSRDARLQRLLDLQRARDRDRGALPRGSEAWLTATDELDALNAQLMQLAGRSGPAPEALDHGLQLDLDARPAGDPEFRASVVGCVREAVVELAAERPAAPTARRRPTSGPIMAAALEAIGRAQACLRAHYPDASLDAWASESTMVSVLADRDAATA